MKAQSRIADIRLEKRFIIISGVLINVKIYSKACSQPFVVAPDCSIPIAKSAMTPAVALCHLCSSTLFTLLPPWHLHHHLHMSPCLVLLCSLSLEFSSSRSTLCTGNHCTVHTVDCFYPFPSFAVHTLILFPARFKMTISPITNHQSCRVVRSDIK